MEYFKDTLTFIKKYKLMSSIILILDILFYSLFFHILNFAVDLFIKQVKKFQPDSFGSMMQSLSGLEELESMLLGIFFGIMGTILLFFLLVLLNIAVMKMIIWLLTTGKKIDYKVILKSLLLTFIMFCIFFIPLILSLFPLISLSEEYMRTQVLKGGIMYFIPFIIIFFITIYFTSLASYFLAKESSLRKALKNCFVIGIKKISQLILPFLGLFIITFAIGNILRNMGLLALWPGLLAVVLVIVIISFFNRIYISRAI